MDERGVPVWFKRTGTTQRVINAQLLSTGEIAVAPITGLGFGIDPLVGHRIYDLDGSLVAERHTDQSVELPDRSPRLRRDPRRSATRSSATRSSPASTSTGRSPRTRSRCRRPPASARTATRCGRQLERDRRQRHPRGRTRRRRGVAMDDERPLRRPRVDVRAVLRQLPACAGRDRHLPHQLAPACRRRFGRLSRLGASHRRGVPGRTARPGRGRVDPGQDPAYPTSGVHPA